MAYLQHLIGCSFVFLLCVQFSCGLQCYVCNSKEDTRCEKEDLPKEDFLKDCSTIRSTSHPYKLCRKIKQTVDISVNGLSPGVRVIRGCGWVGNDTTTGCYLRTGYGLRQEVCSCTEDSCNGSSPLFVSTSLVLFLLSVLKLSL